MFLQVVAGALYSLSFKPVGLWFFAPIALALQIYLLRRYRKPEIQSFLFAFTSGLLILSWSRTFVGVLPWIALAVLQGILAIPIGVIARYTKSFAAITFAILAMEEVRARFPFGGFSWTKIAFSQVDSPLAPLVSVSGMIGLSLATLVLAQALLHPRLKNFAVVLFLFLCAIALPEPGEGRPQLQVRAIQGGVPERGLEFNKRAEAVLDNHIDVTKRNFAASDEVILWPENAIDIDPTRESVELKLRNLALETGKPLIAGAILNREKLYNATILFNSSGEVESTYIKRYLTPFGEYIPLRRFVSLFSPHTDRVTDFSSGDSLVVHRLPQAEISSVICYELLNDGLLRQAATNSALLVVHTNSATFSGSSEGEQQLSITRLRAMEAGTSIASISTTGPSAIIDARGEVMSKLADGEIGSLSAGVSLHQNVSLSHRLGGYLPISVLLLTLIWALFDQRRELKALGRRWIS
jgi:apolipoprotein N-acyltransferase